MSQYGGINMMMGKSKSMGGNKMSPRCGAAKGQGAGMGGYNASAVNKAMSSIAGSGGKPMYSSGAGMQRGKK